MENVSIGIGISAWSWILFQYDQQLALLVLFLLTIIVMGWMFYRASLLPQTVMDAINAVLKKRGSSRIEIDAE
jgi:hypothetical protein